MATIGDVATGAYGVGPAHSTGGGSSDMTMDLFGALSLYGPQLGNPLNPQAQANQYQLLVARQFERAAFYRSCSQHWLDAMLDVELGPP